MVKIMVFIKNPDKTNIFVSFKYCSFRAISFLNKYKIR